jgi:hypothetical protein
LRDETLHGSEVPVTDFDIGDYEAQSGRRRPSRSGGDVPREGYPQDGEVDGREGRCQRRKPWSSKRKGRKCGSDEHDEVLQAKHIGGLEDPGQPIEEPKERRASHNCHDTGQECTQKAYRFASKALH